MSPEFYLGACCSEELRTASTWPCLGKERRMLWTRMFSASPAGCVYAKSEDQEIAKTLLNSPPEHVAVLQFLFLLGS